MMCIGYQGSHIDYLGHFNVKIIFDTFLTSGIMHIIKLTHFNLKDEIHR